jgi:hypothetical protein
MNAETVIATESTIHCSQCGFEKTEAMPINACQYFYRCASSKALLKPKPGDYCVFCIYGTVACPLTQAKVANQRGM